MRRRGRRPRVSVGGRGGRGGLLLVPLAMAQLVATVALAGDFAAPPSLRGMGGAGVAAASGTGALFTNPAALVSQPGQNIEFGFHRSASPSDTGVWVGSADGNRGGIAGGTVYGYRSGSLADGRAVSGYEWRSGMALGAAGDAASFVIGGTLRRVALDVGEGAGAEEVAGWTGDLGLLVGLGSHVRFGAVWRDMIDVGTTVAARATVRDRWGAGLAVALGPVVVAADGLWQGSGDPAWHMGASATLGESVILRAGWRLDPQAVSQQLMAGGAAFRWEQYGLDLAFDIDPSAPRHWSLGLSLVLGIPYVLGGG